MSYNTPSFDHPDVDVPDLSGDTTSINPYPVYGYFLLADGVPYWTATGAIGRRFNKILV